MPKSWPVTGKIEFTDVFLRYRPNLDYALRRLNFTIKAGVKVGVVGRTGAGKSTLGLTLLRIMEIEKGEIKIDGIDIKKVELKTLRERITTIPQDPALFEGSLRFNIDPAEKASDERIDQLITDSGLDALLKIKDGEKYRDFEIQANGDNLSAGEKQLICICRAAVRNAKVVIFDEATANVDVVTEQKLLKLVKNEFKSATVLTIAHRLNTIINSDMIAVMGAEKYVDGKPAIPGGMLLEYGSPTDLLKDPKSDFSNLLKELENKAKMDS